GGEVLPTDLEEQCLTRPGVSLHNQYGPTEAAVHTTCWDCQLEAGVDRVPIGRPIDNMQVSLLDSNLQPVAVGIAGEIYISGAGLGRGYLRRFDLTAEKFVPHPFSAAAGARMYRTGDLARYRADGVLEFLGRIDHQIKIRGFRVEPDEIEAVLASHPAVAANLVLARQNATGEGRLIAYIVPVSGALEGSGRLESHLRHYLQEHLPHYMVPSAFVLLKEFAQTPNGKIDRDALPDPDEGQRPVPEETFVPPQTPAEDLLESIWCAAFHMQRVSTHANFFELGGHSLLAMQMITRIRETFQIGVPLRVLLETQTIAGLAAYLETAYQQREHLPALPLRRVFRTADLPLSFAQESLWFLDQLRPASSLYNVPFAFRLIGTLHVSALESSLTEIVRRHEILRTTYTELPTQVIALPSRISVPVVDLQGLAEAEREALLPSLIDQKAQRPFDLARGPLCRFLLLRVTPGDSVFLASFHHIAFDAWSTGIFFYELGHFYSTACTGQQEALAEAAIQYTDYAFWQRESLQGELLKALLAYWTQHLQGAPALLQLPTSSPRPPVETHRGQRQVQLLSTSLKAQLKQVAMQENVTFFMLLYAAFVVLLHCLSGEHDLVVGTPLAGRTRRETEGSIGFFIHTLALRTRFAGDPCFRDVLAQVRETALQAYAHQDLPFERLVEELRPPRNLSHHPVFQVVFQLVDTPLIPVELAGIVSKSIEIVPHFAKFDLIVTLAEMPAGTLETRADYNTDLFARETIKEMLRHWQRLLESIAQEPGLSVSALRTLLTRG
ncbi:MAG TPA: condensation domain-containing protein, partial [Ktedonobacteraceae bacterium]